MLLIKRYANRKLYDTQAGRYVTLDEIADFIRQGEEISVIDHVTNRDLTSVTLMQILFNEERKIGELFPQVVLTRLIQSGGDTLESLRTRVLAAFDPQSQFDEELHRRLDVLVARGELAVEEAAAWLKKLTSQPEPPPPAQPEVSETSDIDALLRQVQALEAELEALKK